MSTIETVRRHLLDTMAALRDPTNPMDVARAKAVADVATVIINSAKVEVEYLRVTQGKGAPFFAAPALPA